MVKSHKHRHSSKCRHSRRHRKTAKRGGSMLGTAALPIALLGLNSMFGKKSGKSKSRRSRRSRM